MKGKVEVFYEMPLLGEYLKRTGNQQIEQQLQSCLCHMIETAIEYYLNDAAKEISSVTHYMLVNNPVAKKSREIFRKLPPECLYILFDESEEDLQKLSAEIQRQTQRTLSLISRKDKLQKPVVPNTIITTLKKTSSSKMKNGYEYIQQTLKKIEANEMPKEKCKVIFLDLDGVLNTDNYYDQLRHEHLPTEDTFGILFDPKAVEQLAHIVDSTQAKIVISSSWRYSGIANMRAMWKARKLPGVIYDITSLHVADDYIQSQMENNPNDFDLYDVMILAREMEIALWLEEHPEVTSYVILDDQSTFRQLKEHFVLINQKFGITNKDTERVITILNNLNNHGKSNI